MKKNIVLTICLLMSFLSYGQNLINSDDSGKAKSAQLDTMPITYVHVLLADNGKNSIAMIDAGDGISWGVANKEGNKLRGFKSPNQLFNFMYDNQWEYVDTIENVSSTGAFGQIMFGVNTTKTRLIYIFKRRKN